MNRTASLFALLVLFTTNVFAADAWLIRFQSHRSSPPSSYWRDDALFLNTNSEPVTVKFLGMSNSPPVADVPDLELPPNQMVSLQAEWPVGDRWRPDVWAPLYVVHVDVPPGVVVESRNEFWVAVPSEGGTTVIAKASMPILRELTPANVPQVHLGTDIGRAPSHINVGIYNAGREAAVAEIELRRPCSDSIVSTVRTIVAPNTVVQVGGIPDGGVGTLCTRSSAGYGFVKSVTVRVDQPSLSFITNVADAPCSPNPIVPCLGFTHPMNTRF
jgi:hypothetical protein